MSISHQPRCLQPADIQIERLCRYDYTIIRTHFGYYIVQKKLSERRIKAKVKNKKEEKQTPNAEKPRYKQQHRAS